MPCGQRSYSPGTPEGEPDTGVDVTTTAPAAARVGTAVPDSPAARRTEQPRWRDKRLALGVVLVLVAIVLGARLLDTAGRTDPVVVAARPLPAGHVITADDLAVRRVRLGDTTGRYWPGADLAGLTGHPLTTSVAPGDLVPRSAVGATADPKPARVVSLPMDPSRLPPLSAGDVVDVFATTKAASGAASTTTAVLRGVRYVGGGDTSSGSSVAVRLEVPVDQTAAVVRASEVDTLDVVLQRSAGDDAGDVGTQPLS